MAGDRNFDDLAHRFANNIYQTLKGRIRLSVIDRDLRECVPELFAEQPLSLLDAGCGRAPVSNPLLAFGHSLSLVDVSVEMLKLALADVEGCSNKPAWFHGSVMQFQQQRWDGALFNVIFCHAVIEWVEDPLALLRSLKSMLAADGMLSLTFYNRDGLIYKNLLRTNFSKIKQQSFSGSRRSLTPSYPRTIEEVKQWSQTLGFNVVCHSGIRVFHDYIFNGADRDRSPEELLEMELEFSRYPAFRELGRYQHLILRL